MLRRLVSAAVSAAQREPINVLQSNRFQSVIPCPTGCSCTAYSNVLESTKAGQIRSFSTSEPSLINFKPPKGWLKYNEVVFPPTKEGETERPAEVYHQRPHVKYQFDKMMYLCRMVRGMSVDEAKKQLPFKQKAGAQILLEIIEEAQEEAVKNHNVEYKSNLWIAEAFPTRAGHVMGLRKHAKTYRGKVHYRYIHVFIKLREGDPPEHYYVPKLTGHEHKAKYIEDMRKRRIYNAL